MHRIRYRLRALQDLTSPLIPKAAANIRTAVTLLHIYKLMYLSITVHHSKILYQVSLASVPFQSSRVSRVMIDLGIYKVGVEVEGRDSSVGIATRYGLEGPGIESR